MKLEAAIKSLTDSVKNKDWAYGPAVQSVLHALAASEKDSGELEQSLNVANAATQEWKQRAKAAEARVGVLEGIIARKEFDSLKGEQVPVGVTAENLRVIEMLLNVCSAAFELADDSCQQDVDGELCHVVPDSAFSRLSDALGEIENTLPYEYEDLPNIVLQWAAIPRHALRSIFTAQQKPVALPEINEDLVDILGRPNFTCSGIAGLFRRNGADIKRKSENEQAFVIHWLIGVYLTHGSEWRATAEAELKSIADKIKADGYIVKTEGNHAEP